MSLFYFVLGFFSAFAAGAALIFVAGAKTRPLLADRLEKLREERRTTRAKAVKASLSVDKFKVTSIEAVQLQSTPAHISSAGVPCRLAMIGGAVTISTAYALRAASSHARQGSEDPAATKRQDRAIATFSAKNVSCTIDKKNRSVIHLVPKAGVAHICEATDVIGGETKSVPWRALTLGFEGGPREADRWNAVFNQDAAAERWLKFTKTVPEGAATSFNLFVARILFANSAGPTLDEFISSKIRKKLAHVSLPSPLAGNLQLVDLHFGDDSPFFTNPAFTGFACTGEFGFDVDLLYRGGLTLVLSVTLQIGPLRVPNLVLEIKIGQIKGRIHMSIGGPPSNKMWVGFHEQPELRIELKQDIHLPAEAKLIAAAIRGIDISEIVSEVVKTKLFEDMILPAMDDLPIPDLGPTPPSTPNTPVADPARPPKMPQLSDWTDVGPETAAAAAAAKPAVKAAPAPVPTAKPIVTKADADKQLAEHLAVGAAAVPRQSATPPLVAVAPKPAAAAAEAAARPSTPPAAAKSSAPGSASTTPSRRERIESEVDEKAAKVLAVAHEARERVAKLLHSRHHHDDAEAPIAAADNAPTPAKTQAPAAAATANAAAAAPVATTPPKPTATVMSTSGSNDSFGASTTSAAAPATAASAKAVADRKSPASVQGLSPSGAMAGGIPPPPTNRPASSASDGSWVKDVGHTTTPGHPASAGLGASSRKSSDDDVLAGEPMTRADTNSGSATATAPVTDSSASTGSTSSPGAEPAPGSAAPKGEEAEAAKDAEHAPAPAPAANTYMRPRYAQSQPQW